MVITDLDGTLLHRESPISVDDINTLEKLGERSILRVIATGRSLFSAERVLVWGFPIDFLIFSSGAGIIDWQTRKLLRKQSMEVDEVERAAGLLLRLKLDFMLHDPIPHNHRFAYYGSGDGNQDFFRRINIYREFATRGNPLDPQFHEACQIVVVEPPGGSGNLYEHLKSQLVPLKVIRTTSPTDGQSTWIEIFPGSVSKAHGAEWLRTLHSIPLKAALAIGNDYNDLDLLSWAPSRYVVDNAPDELKRLYSNVRSGKHNGFTEAVERWLKEGGLQGH